MAQHTLWSWLECLRYQQAVKPRWTAGEWGEESWGKRRQQQQHLRTSECISQRWSNRSCRQTLQYYVTSASKGRLYTFREFALVDFFPQNGKFFWDPGNLSPVNIRKNDIFGGGSHYRRKQNATNWCRKNINMADTFSNKKSVWQYTLFCGYIIIMQCSDMLIV